MIFSELERINMHTEGVCFSNIGNIKPCVHARRPTHYPNRNHRSTKASEETTVEQCLKIRMTKIHLVLNPLNFVKFKFF
jgi:hypothetical protein